MKERLKNDDKSDNAREIPILRLTNSQNDSNGELNKNGSGAIDDTDLSSDKPECEEATKTVNGDQSADKNAATSPIKVPKK